MAGVAQIITDLLVSGRLFKSLEAGLEATEDALSDALDGTLMAICPAYNTAMTAASAVPELGESLTAIKRKIFRKVMAEMQLDHLIQELVNTWHAIPSSIRTVVAAGVQQWSSVVAFYEHPSIGSFVNAAKMYGYMCKAYASVVAAAVAKGLTDGPAWLKHALDESADGIADYLDDADIPALGYIVRVSGKTLADGLSLDGAKLRDAYYDFKNGDVVGGVTDILATNSDIGGLTSSIKHGDVGGALKAGANIVAGPVASVWNAIF